MIYYLSKLKKNDYLFISEILKKGEILIYPTETIYGLGGNALDENVYRKIIEIKNREERKNFIWLFKDIDMLKKYVFFNKMEENLLKKSITVILKSKIDDFNSIACRISPHPFLKKLFNFIDFPLISTSANISGKKYEHNFEKIIKIFNDKINLFIKDDISKEENPLPSTIVKVENNKIIILRQGKLKNILQN